MQKDMKRLIAYSSVSHLGFCTLGIFALNPNGLAGSVLQQINHGIVHRRAVLDRRHALRNGGHTRLISEFGGLATPCRILSAIYAVIISLSSLGMPLLNGFYRRVHDSAGAFQVSKRGLRGFARVVRRVTAVAVPARDVRPVSVAYLPMKSCRI